MFGGLKEAGKVTTGVAVRLLLAAAVAGPGCHRLPAPATEVISYREFGWLGLTDVDAVSTQVSLSNAGDWSVRHVDSEALESTLRGQLGGCGVPVRPHEQFESPFLDVRVAVREVGHQFAYSVDVELYKRATLGNEEVIDYSAWRENTLGTTESRVVSELNGAIRSSLHEIVETFCREYREGQAERGRRTRG